METPCSKIDYTSVTPSWASCDIKATFDGTPHVMQNRLNGEWVSVSSTTSLVNPINGAPMVIIPNTSLEEATGFITSLKKCPKSGLHNPLKNVERYRMYGDVSHRLAAELFKPEVEDYFTKLIMLVCPKDYTQARGEVTVSRTFLQNFSGDQPRFLAGGSHVPGDHLGQQSNSYRWPFGPCAIVSPFNFPLEIPVLQLLGALYMGNKVLLKSATTTTLVMEQFLRLMEYCGAPAADVDFINCGGRVMGALLGKIQPACTQFTGSSSVAQELITVVHGRIKIEDAGFDWKILGPDPAAIDHVAWQCDQDAYNLSGQKCSAQSILFAHEKWMKAGIIEKITALAAKRTVTDLTIGPVLSHTTEDMLEHANKLSSLPGARLLFGGKALTNHVIPSQYGAIEPTAVFVPIETILMPEHFHLCTREIFGPFQVVTEYTSEQLPLVIETCERMDAHLTAAVVSSDPRFLAHVLGNTVNGTTYAGMRARTTGAPQNHWFGPAGSPLGAGIGTPGAIRLVWSCNREIITDVLAPM
eukprot:gnl/Dysnectes_brevis/331_a366_6752.p1 GENE.gnl/Dysnectes_brevis/331_a366_6752~~gnl/Dysnectes_brevis/331_a366_6752.p1  ORF type:complete len:538 (-),score=84.64 gnl/Dysnectes_brevis/331_a366_6752:67-1647(-)